MAATLTSCSGGGPDEDVTLKVVAADYGTGEADKSDTYWNGVAKSFEASHPGIKVQVTVLPWTDIDRKVSEMVASGHAPDIAQIGAYADYAKAGKLYSADQMLSIPTQANFLPKLADAGRVDRVQYGLPFVASTRLLFYNKDLFSQAGLTAPKTWGDIAADAAALKGRGVRYPFALPLGPEESQAETLQWVLSGGGGYTDDVGTYTIDSPENVRTFGWLKENLVDKGLTGPVAPRALNRAKAFEAFGKGQVGMLNGHPTLMEDAEKKGVHVGMVKLPGANGPTKTSMGVADWIMGFKQNDHRVEIGKFFDFLFTDKNVIEFADTYDMLPVTDSASAAMEDDPQYKPLHQFLATLSSAEFYPFGKTSWAKASESIKENIGKAVDPGATPGLVLEHIAQEATAAEKAE
ncbi:ABC transporter substrate-binding protein [Streptomyces sp. NPDC059783]|uniref:ABC transporter substrate-binding protein n=1 Tax=Streptomyces sp. NPDC059783 TaxID=3346944 RepID=UPI003666AE3F